MELTHSILHKDEIIICKKLVEYIEQCKDKWETDKLFIVIDIDKHQSPFAWMSCNSDIGVLAKSKLVGHILLCLLEIVVNKNFGLMLDIYVPDDDRDDFPEKYMSSEGMELFIKMIHNTQQILFGKVNVYSLNEKIPIKNTKQEIMYYKELKSIDSWDIKRIKKSIDDLSSEAV